MSTHPPITPGGGDENADLVGEVSPPDEPQASAFESLLRHVARAPVEADIPPPAELAPGVIVAGRFELVREIGRGGFARVFEARDRVLSRPVAIKLLKWRRRLKDSELELFYREARTTARLNHPHIVTAYDWGAWNDTPFLVLELLDGESLEKHLAGKPLDEDRAWQIITEVTEALAYAHSLGVLHLDLKSQNVFVLRDGRVKVLDFGLAGLDWDEDIPGRLVRIAGGTPGTMAPEQAEGAPTDARADIWAVGVILHQLLFGRLPEQLAPGAERVSLPAGASSRAERVLARTLRRDPGARYPDAASLLASLAAAEASTPESPTAPAQGLRLGRTFGLIGLTAGILAVAWALWRVEDEKWLRSEVIPAIHRLADSNQLMAAQRLAMKANAALPGNSELRSAWRTFARPNTITTQPPGAKVFWREYNAPNAAWEYLGRTPLSLLYPVSTYRLRFELEGYRSYEAAPLPAFVQDPFPLDRVGAIADDLVHVPGGHFGPGLEGQQLALGGYLLDRYEVTNRRYKAFIDAGGYQRPEYWRQPFVKDGRALRWEEAMPLFTDRTGHRGPSTWELGSHPRGQDNYPVSGVSWYEAAAYAAFEGRELPTFSHWQRAAGLEGAGSIVQASNFAEKGAAPVGQYPGISEFGAFDMAGNVREWCFNEGIGRPGERFILGGAWNDPTYTFSSPGIQSAWDRSSTNGLRLVTYSEASPNLELAKEPVETAGAANRDYSKEKPVGDSEFRIFQRLYAYDRKPLNPVVVQKETGTDRIREKVSFDAAYGKERVIAYLFLPREGRPPYQTVIFFPGMGALPGATSFDEGGGKEGPAAFIIRSGRALMYPIYRGTFERPTELKTILPNTSVAYRDAVIQWTKDLRRSIDYLETRDDIDRERIGYYGLSWGGLLGGLIPAVEPRLRAAVLNVAGLQFVRPLPEADPFNFLPHVKIPVLILNGRYDQYFPLETSQVPMFQLLGAPPDQKRHLIYEAGHIAPRDQVIKETLAWYDRYLGPVANSTPVPSPAN